MKLCLYWNCLADSRIHSPVGYAALGLARAAVCLHPLPAQDYPDFEVIVIDDQSSDATPAILANEAAGFQSLRLSLSGRLTWKGRTLARPNWKCL